MAFTFRAQAALDLRRRELEEAQRQLARAEGDRDLAKQRVSDAAAAVAQARGTAGEAHKQTTTSTDLQWYRFWILRLEHEHTAFAATLATREEAVRRASAACLEARKRRESLEKFRGKARHAYDTEQAALERKLIDELATRRYAAAHTNNR